MPVSAARTPLTAYRTMLAGLGEVMWVIRNGGRSGWVVLTDSEAVRRGGGVAR